MVKLLSITSIAGSLAGLCFTWTYDSTWSPTWDMDIAANLGAPGSQILSTTLNGNHEYLTGTSMAAPLLSGILSLPSQARRCTGLQPITFFIAQQLPCTYTLIHQGEPSEFPNDAIGSRVSYIQPGLGDNCAVVTGPERGTGNVACGVEG